MSKKRLIFPLVNALALAALFGVVGFYAWDVPRWALIGAVAGFLVGLLAEFALQRAGGWLYRRRALLIVLLEIPLIIFVVGPYGYVVAMTRPIQGTVCCAPAAFGDRYETVLIPVADGETLAGWYVPPAKNPGPVIMLLHGSASTRIGTTWHAVRLVEAGYGVLMYDQRALGESTGSTQSLGWLDRRDVPHIVDFLAARPEVDAGRIGAVGLSLGAHILIMAGPDEPRIAAFWLDGAGTNRVGDFPPAENFNEQFAWVINAAIETSVSVYLGLAPPPPFSEQIPRLAPRPVLMIVGAADDFERRANERYTALLGENAEQWVLEGVPHVGGPNYRSDEYLSRMLAFFEQALAG